MPPYQLFHRATSRSVGVCRAIAISLGWCLCLLIMSRSSNDVFHITYGEVFHLRMSKSWNHGMGSCQGLTIRNFRPLRHRSIPQGPRGWGDMDNANMEMASWHRPATGHARVHVSPLSPGGQGEGGGSGRATQVCCQSPASELLPRASAPSVLRLNGRWCGAGLVHDSVVSCVMPP
jgi:hypothetical protein